MTTCFIRYWVDPNKMADFEHYARTWMKLIEKYGGTHLGYWLPDEAPPSATFSFPGIGERGPDNVAIAVFSFPNLEAYETYRREVANDPECISETKLLNETRCFTKYERTFMKQVGR